MIIACTKPAEDIQKQTERSNISISLSDSERCQSVPNISRTEHLLESEISTPRKPTFLFSRQTSLPYAFHVNKDEEEAYDKKKVDSFVQRSIKKKQSVKEKETNNILTHNKNKSNASVKSFGKNYVLKSDVCKVTKSNFYCPYQETNPWLNYYKDIVNHSKNAINTDYSLFLKNSEKETMNNMDFNTSNYFDMNPQNKREIMINRYTENNEMVDYDNSNNYYNDFEEETVSVEVPIVVPNMVNKKSTSSLSDSISSEPLNDSMKKVQQLPIQSQMQGQGQQLAKGQISNSSPVSKFNNLPKNNNNNVNINNSIMSTSPMYPNVIVNNNNSNNNNTNNINNNNNNNFNGNPLPPNYPLMNQMNQFYPKQPQPQPQLQPQPMVNNYPYQKYAYPNMTNIMPPFIPPQQNLNYPTPNPNHNPNLNPFIQHMNPNIPPYNQYMHPNMNMNMMMDMYSEYPQNNINSNNDNLQSQNNANLNNLKRLIKNGSCNYSNYSDESLAQLAPFLVKEQGGCRYVQDKVLSDPKFGNNILFPYIKNHINDLICDAFGNYLFQVLIDILTIENLAILLKLISPSFYLICISPHGTRVIQKVIDKISSNIPLVLTFKEMLSYYLIDICKDAYGNHIVQKYLAIIHYPNNQFIYDFIYANFLEVANTKHGCCVIQKCISEGNEDQRRQILLIIQNNLHELITDQYGNYTIQYLFSSEDNTSTRTIINSVLGNILYLCKLKYSSNVLEKCFENTNTEIQMMIINELTKNDNLIAELISDTYGNYVIQKALLVCKDSNYIKILTVIANNVNRVKKQPFGGKLISKLLATHKELAGLIANAKKEKYSYSGNNSMSMSNANTRENDSNFGDESIYTGYNYNHYDMKKNNRGNNGNSNSGGKNQNWNNNAYYNNNKAKRKQKDRDK